MGLSVCKSFLIYGFIRAGSLIIPQKFKKIFIALTRFTTDCVPQLLLALLGDAETFFFLQMKMLRDVTSHWKVDSFKAPVASELVAFTKVKSALREKWEAGIGLHRCDHSQGQSVQLRIFFFLPPASFSAGKLPALLFSSWWFFLEVRVSEGVIYVPWEVYVLTGTNVCL